MTPTRAASLKGNATKRDRARRARDTQRAQLAAQRVEPDAAAVLAQRDRYRSVPRAEEPVRLDLGRDAAWLTGGKT